MNKIDVTQDRDMLKNINMQTVYTLRVLLTHMDNSIHMIITEQDTLVNQFDTNFYQSVVVVLNELKAKYSLFDRDLGFLETKYEKSLSLINNVDDLTDYEAELVDTRYQLNSLLEQLDLKIEKYSKEKV
ncbi:MAG: hypothetical protein U9Q40_02635 [Campylobacterota bacterium]|nr:hypothetical protein [Campylobacterota bacterium]